MCGVHTAYLQALRSARERTSALKARLHAHPTQTTRNAWSARSRMSGSLQGTGRTAAVGGWGVETGRPFWRMRAIRKTKTRCRREIWEGRRSDMEYRITQHTVGRSARSVVGGPLDGRIARRRGFGVMPSMHAWCHNAPHHKQRQQQRGCNVARGGHGCAVRVYWQRRANQWSARSSVPPRQFRWQVESPALP